MEMETPIENQHDRRFYIECTDVFVDYTGKNAISGFDQTTADLCFSFESLSISKTIINDHLKKRCTITLKKQLRSQPSETHVKSLN